MLVFVRRAYAGHVGMRAHGIPCKAIDCFGRCGWQAAGAILSILMYLLGAFAVAVIELSGAPG